MDQLTAALAERCAADGGVGRAARPSTSLRAAPNNVEGGSTHGDMSRR